MKKFRFPLRSVATLRAMRESRERESFALAVRATQAAAEEHRLAGDRVVALDAAIREHRAVAFRAADQPAFAQARRDAVGLEQAAAARLAAARTEQERRRQIWLEARRDLRLLENLETRARAEHQREVDHEQQALLDDRANAQAAAASRAAA